MRYPLRPEPLAIRAMVDFWTLDRVYEDNRDLLLESHWRSMEEALGRAVVEQCSHRRMSKRMDLSGGAYQLDLMVNVVPKGDTWRFESRAAGMSSDHWLVRFVSACGDQLFKLSNWLEHFL